MPDWENKNLRNSSLPSGVPEKRKLNHGLRLELNIVASSKVEDVIAPYSTFVTILVSKLIRTTWVSQNFQDGMNKKTKGGGIGMVAGNDYSAEGGSVLGKRGPVTQLLGRQKENNMGFRERHSLQS